VSKPVGDGDALEDDSESEDESDSEEDAKLMVPAESAEDDESDE